MKPDFESGDVQLYCGDSLEIKASLVGVDAVITDPPYGIAYQHSGRGKGKHDRKNLQKIIGDDAPFDPSPWLEYPIVAMFGADHFAQRLPHGRMLVWDKLAGMASFDKLLRR